MVLFWSHLCLFVDQLTINEIPVVLIYFLKSKHIFIIWQTMQLVKFIVPDDVYVILIMKFNINMCNVFIFNLPLDIHKGYIV